MNLQFVLIQPTQKDVSDVKLSDELSDGSSDDLSDCRSTETTCVPEEGRAGRWLRRGTTTPPTGQQWMKFLSLCVCVYVSVSEISHETRHILMKLDHFWTLLISKWPPQIIKN